MEVNGIIICYANFCLPNSFLRSIIMCWGKAVLCGSCRFSSSLTSAEPGTRADFSGLRDGVLAWGQQSGGKNRVSAEGRKCPSVHLLSSRASTQARLRSLTVWMNGQSLPLSGSPPAWVLRCGDCWSRASAAEAPWDVPGSQQKTGSKTVCFHNHQNSSEITALDVLTLWFTKCYYTLKKYEYLKCCLAFSE